MWVKVCGLTRTPDVAAAVEAGADAVGFVAYAGSPRYAPVEAIATLARGVPITRIVLTVDVDVDAALEIVRATGVDGIQPYGQHAADVSAAARSGGLMVLRPVTAAPNLDLPVHDGAIPLVDTSDESLHGGTGRTFDWSLVRDIGRSFVLAGGLGPDNVAAAIAATRPWGVDASSRLEVEPGVKDAGKVAAFIQEAKQA